MYQVALSVEACRRSGTRADIAWVVEAHEIPIEDWSDAVVFTPGGGRIGSLAGGALDARLSDLAGRWSAGRVIAIEIDPVEALIAGLPAGGSARCLMVPADILPDGTIELALARQPFALLTSIEGDEVVEMRLSTADVGAAGSTLTDEGLVTSFRAVTQMVIVGDSPVAEALGVLAPAVGWRARALVDSASATGVIATLSALDVVVVTGHDLELAGSALKAAMDSDVGYIGSLGSRKMQENRADWLAYRGVTDLTRVHGPAGLDIGAETPAEIAVSILAEAISERSVDRVGA
jgi:xanthine dehydrogenase accessory factor